MAPSPPHALQRGPQWPDPAVPPAQTRAAGDYLLSERDGELQDRLSLSNHARSTKT